MIRVGEDDANVGQILRNHVSVVEGMVRQPRTGQHREWQKAVADGAIIGLAATELETPKVGDVRPNTTWTPDGDDYLLNGTKYYSTGTLYSDYVLVRTANSAGVNAATLIPVNREGIELIDDWDGLGQRLTATGTTHFRQVRVKRQEVVFDAPDAGYGIPYSNTFAQLFLTAINAGIARAILRDATALVQSRKRTFYYAPAEIPTDDPLRTDRRPDRQRRLRRGDRVLAAAEASTSRPTRSTPATQMPSRRRHRAAPFGQGQDQSRTNSPSAAVACCSTLVVHPPPRR